MFEKFFRFSEKKTTLSTEIIAGITTFMTMAYVLVVQPSAMIGAAPEFIDCAGVLISKEAVMVMVSLVSFVITLLMGLYANMPFALSCGMGTNFLLGSMVQTGELSYGSIMGIILISGIIFLLLSIFGIRDLIVRMIPKNIKIAISACIGFFIAYLGLKDAGICDFSAGLAMGDFTQLSTILSLVGLLVIAALTAYKVKGAILIGIIAITIIAIPLGVTSAPTAIVAIPDIQNIGNLVFNISFEGILNASGLILVFVAFFGDFFSTLGTVLGVANKANMLDENGNLPGIAKPFLVDAIGTCVGALFGCTTITTFVESTSGVEAGGRTGMTAIVTSLCFFAAMFFAPLVSVIPTCATGPALVFVGFLMISGFKDIDFSDFTEAFGPFVMIMFGTFMASIAAGIASGIIAHVFIKVITGKFKEVHPAMYILCIPLLMYFIVG